MSDDCIFKSTSTRILQLAGVLACALLMGCTSTSSKWTPLNLFHSDWRYSCASGYYDCALGSRGESEGRR